MVTLKSIKEMIDTISHKRDKMTITLHNGWEYCFFADDRIPYCDLYMYGILHNVEFYDDYEVVYQLIKASYKVIASNLLGVKFDDKREILTITPQYENGDIVYSVWIDGEEYMTNIVTDFLNLEFIKEALEDEV